MKRGTTLVMGQVIGQLFLIAVIPLLTRVFSPAEMGVYQIALAIALILQPVATLKIEAHIPAAPNGATVSAYNRRAAMAVALTCLLGIALSGMLLAFGSAYSEHMFVASLLLAAFAWMALDTALLIRTGELLRLTVRHLLVGFFTALLQLIAAVTIGEVWSLAVALLLGRSFAIVATRSRSKQDDLDSSGVALRSARDTGAAVAGSMAVNLSNQAPVLYLAGMFGSTAAGHLGIADRVAATPINLVGRSLAQFVQSSLAPFVRERKVGLFRTSLRFTFVTSGIAAVCATGLFILGPLLAEPVLGPEWGVAGQVIAILALPFSIRLVALPMTHTLIMIGREKSLLWLQLIRLPIPLLFVAIAYIGGAEFVSCCIALSIGLSISYGLFIGCALYWTFWEEQHGYSSFG